MSPADCTLISWSVSAHWRGALAEQLWVPRGADDVWSGFSVYGWGVTEERNKERSGKNRESKGGGDIERVVLWRCMNKSEVFIFSHYTVVTAPYGAFFTLHVWCTVYEDILDSRDDAHPFLDTWPGVCAEQAFPRHWFFSSHVVKRTANPPLLIEVNLLYVAHLHAKAMTDIYQVEYWVSEGKCWCGITDDVLFTSSFIIKKPHISTSALSLWVKMH